MTDDMIRAAGASTTLLGVATSGISAPSSVGGAPEGEQRWSVSAWTDWLERAFVSHPARFRHSVGVLRRGRAALADSDLVLTPERKLVLELACLLHDVGRALDPHDTEPHGFVGARFLEAVGLVTVAPLVAHHSGARFEASARGMEHLDRWRIDDRELLCLLTFFDRTTSPGGEPVTMMQRRDDLLRRSAPGSTKVVSFDLAAADAARGRMLLGTANRIR